MSLCSIQNRVGGRRWVCVGGVCANGQINSGYQRSVKEKSRRAADGLARVLAARTHFIIHEFHARTAAPPPPSPPPSPPPPSPPPSPLPCTLSSAVAGEVLLLLGQNCSSTTACSHMRTATHASATHIKSTTWHGKTWQVVGKSTKRLTSIQAGYVPSSVRPAAMQDHLARLNQHAMIRNLRPHHHLLQLLQLLQLPCTHALTAW